MNIRYGLVHIIAGEHAGKTGFYDDFCRSIDKCLVYLDPPYLQELVYLSLHEIAEIPTRPVPKRKKTFAVPERPSKP